MCAKPPPKSQHPATFNGHKSCESVDIHFFKNFMWPHTTNVTKGSCGFNGGSYSQ